MKSAGFEDGNIAEIRLNGNLIYVEKNESNHYRGLHIVIVNPANGKVEFAQVFDTHKAPDNFDNFIKKVMPDRHIIIAACKDDCKQHLSDQARVWFGSMGSFEIYGLIYRKGFAFIG